MVKESLLAKCVSGCVVVTGNREVFWRRPRVREAFPNQGLRALRQSLSLLTQHLTMILGRKILRKPPNAHRLQWPSCPIHWVAPRKSI